MSASAGVSEPDLSLEDFRAALSMWPSGVTITTTTDETGERWGFTASAFSSLSLNPPLILVCLAAEANCHDAFLRADRFAVNLLGGQHQELAIRFATKGSSKFEGADFVEGRTGSPLLADSMASLECAAHATIPAGDHTILIGRVLHAYADPAASDSAAMVHFARSFRAVSPLHDASAEPAGH